MATPCPRNGPTRSIHAHRANGRVLHSGCELYTRSHASRSAVGVSRSPVHEQPSRSFIPIKSINSKLSSLVILVNALSM